MFLMLPIKDLPPSQERDHRRPAPLVTLALIAANLAVFVLVSLPLMEGDLFGRTDAYHIFLNRYGFRATEPAAISILTSLFLHGGWLHLLFNMLFLWIFAPTVEAKLGRGGFLVTYLVLGVVATLAYGSLNAGSGIPLVGASGAIYGVLGVYFLWFPQRRIRTVLMVLWLIRFAELPARLVLGIFVVVHNMIPFLLESQTGVAYSAHLGGFAGGLVLSWIWQQARPSRPSRMAPPDFPLEDPGKALAHYGALAPHERAALPAQTIFSLSKLLGSCQRGEQALAVVQRFIATHPTDDALPQAHLLAGRLHWDHFHRPTPAYQHMLTVLDLAPQGNEANGARELLATIEASRNRL